MSQGSVTWGALRKSAEDAMRPLAKDVRLPVVVEAAKHQKASTGSDMVVANLAVFEGNEHINRKIFNNFVLSPDNAFAMTMFFRNMAAFGLDEAFFAQLESTPGGPEEHMGIIAQALVGRKAYVTMGEPRVFQNVARDNPVKWEPYAGQPPAQLGTASGLPPTAAGTTMTGVPPVPQTTTAGPPPVPSF